MGAQRSNATAKLNASSHELAYFSHSFLSQPLLKESPTNVIDKLADKHNEFPLVKTQTECSRGVTWSGDKKRGVTIRAESNLFAILTMSCRT